MDVYYDDKNVLHVCPENSVEVMANKYYKGEYEDHGDVLLEIHTEVVHNPDNPKPHKQQ